MAGDAADCAGEQMSQEEESAVDMKSTIFLFTQRITQIYEEILYEEEIAIVCENVLKKSPRFRKWVQERKT